MPRPNNNQKTTRDSAPFNTWFFVHWSTITVCAICLLGTILVTNSIYQSTIQIRDNKLTLNAKKIANEIKDEFFEYEEVLNSAAAFVTASNQVTRAEWKQFVVTADVTQRHPGIFGIAFVKHLHPHQVDEFLINTRADDAPNFNIRLQPGADAYHPANPLYVIKYHEPAEFNKSAWGINIAGKSVGKKAYQESMHSGSAKLSAPLFLDQTGNTQFGVVMSLPIYDTDKLPNPKAASKQQRADVIIGWAAMPIGLDTYIKSLRNPHWNDYTLKISYTDPENQTHTEVHSSNESQSLISEKFNRDTSINLFGLALNLKIEPANTEIIRPNFAKTYQFFGISILITALITAVTHSVSRTKSRAESIARIRTAQLQASETQQREFAYHAHQANKAKSLFLANMSHEIRTPMTSVLGYTDLLDEMTPEHSNPEQMKQAVNNIQRAGAHLLMVINDVLDLSKIESGKLPINPVPCRIGEILAEVYANTIPHARERELELNFRFDTPIPETLVIDPYRIRQILLNLISNAIKFTPQGSVTVIMSADDSAITIAVQDTGIGVNQDELENIFRPFEQEHPVDQMSYSPSNFRNKGTGLGLSISRQLAEMMEGNLSATSTQSIGSTFTCKFPIIHPHQISNVETKAQKSTKTIKYINALPEEPQSSPNPAIVTKKITGRILLAEDGQDNQNLLKHYLSKAGLTVEFVWNGQQAVDRYARTNPEDFELIIMDMEMPVLDGYQATTQLRKHGCTIPILALTANTMSGDRQRCLSAGCDDYESKPINRARLLRTIERLLGGESQDQQATDQSAA